jgi:tetratricopeptide (TPR) repeat protein
MVDEWVSKRMEKSGDLSQHRDRFIEAATVVPQAMDLGILLLQHAQGIEDADARRKQLEHSESIFMSVQAAAGDNPQYQLFLGQVKYWLGKSAEGEGLFSQFLASGDPDRPPFTAMFAVAGTYRKVGEMAKARAIYEDVYSRAEDEDIKDSAANMRAVSATDTEDSIHWLKLCKNQRPNVLASLASNEGILALQNGDTDTAISKFNESINIYESMPEDAVNLNNSALVFNHLFDATGDIKHHEQGIQRLRKAHSLAPEDSITMGNFASNLRTASLIAVTRDTIDYPALRQEPRSDLLSAIATDRASRLALRKRLVENAQFREATSYLSKARVLSPKSISLYSQLTQMHTWRQDLSALTQLHQDLITAELDLSDMNAEFLDIYAGNQDADRLADSLQALTGLQARMESIGETTAATAAFMHIQVADAVENLWTHDRKLNPDLAIQAAEKAIDTHASQNARRTLASAYILRCAAATLPRTPVYTRFIAMNSVVNVVAVALNSGDSTLREAILAHDDFKKGLAIHKQEALADANYQHPWLWAMARHADAEFANTVAATVKADEISRANRAIIGVLTPLAGNTIYGSAWAAELVGDKAAADKILAQAKAAGVPLPQ